MFLHASVYVFACVIFKFSVFAVSAISGVKANFKYDKLFYSEKKILIMICTLKITFKICT